MVVWSECLFFIKKPVLSFFALFVQAAAKNSGYFYVEVSLLKYQLANVSIYY